VLPGLAQSGVDYVYNASDPLYWIAWEYTTLWSRMHAHGFFGMNGIVEDIYGRFWADQTTVQMTVYSDPTVRGDLSASSNWPIPRAPINFISADKTFRWASRSAGRLRRSS